MSAIVGMISSKDFIGKSVENIFRINVMLQALGHRGGLFSDTYIKDNAAMGQAQLCTQDNFESVGIAVKVIEDKEYAIVFDGAIYNRDKVDFNLASAGVGQPCSDAEAVLLAYIAFGTDCVKELNGIFAFVIYDKLQNQFFLARDHFGVKSLFYAQKDNFLLFASEIKGLFASGLLKKEIGSNGIAEIFGLAPSRTAGECIYKGINELRPAECAVYDQKGLRVWEYWQLQAAEHKDSLNDTIEKVKALVFDTIERQTTPNSCAFLSGGLDSSIIAVIATKKLEQYGKRLHSFAIDYAYNDKYFKTTAYQPDSDNAYALLMAEYCKSIHKNYIADSGEKLAISVIEAALARDLPGMADIDGSLLLFCKEIARHCKVALSGECADEIFGGYPWYMTNSTLDTFPWMKQKNIRSYILRSDFQEKYQIKEYVQDKFASSLAQAPLLDTDDADTVRFRRLQYLNIYWFMATLLERSALMSMHSGLEIRVPFCDPNIVSYLYNVPPKLKMLENREKGLLRRAVAGLLPTAVIERKKSPYPKTFNPQYEEIVKEMLKQTLKKDSILKDAIDLDKLLALFAAPSDYGATWFGQLMSTPQLYGYLLQVHCLFNKL